MNRQKEPLPATRADRKNTLRWFLIAAVLLPVALIVSLSSCGKIKEGWEDVPGSPRVLVSFPPLYCFATSVAGEDVAVKCLCTDIGPHDYRFNIQDSVVLRRADLFVANGLGLDDHFCDRMNANSSNAKLVYRKVGDQLQADMRIKAENQGEHAHSHEDGHDHHHHHGEYDPHFWLGIDESIAVVEQIRDQLKKVDPKKASTYEKNAAAYIARLRDLHRKWTTVLAANKTPIITFHESMGYFAKSFKLNVIGHLQPAPGIDPTAVNFRDLLEKVGKQPRVIITVEPQYPRNAAEMLQARFEKEGKTVHIVEIDPLETYNPQKEELTPDWYEKKMEKNLQALAEKLK